MKLTPNPLHRFATSTLALGLLLAAPACVGFDQAEARPDTREDSESPAMLMAEVQASPDGEAMSVNEVAPPKENYSRAGGVTYEETPVQSAVLQCMQECGELGEVSDDIRTCELLCAQSAWSPVYGDDCTISCMNDMYTCRADCSRDVEHATDVATCGLNCGVLAEDCLANRCEEVTR